MYEDILRRIIALLGVPLKKLHDPDIAWREVKWSHVVPNTEDKWCQTAGEY